MLENNDEQAKAEFWVLFEKVARRILSRHLGGRLLCEDDLDDKVSIAMEYVIRRYYDKNKFAKTKKNYAVRKNFISVIKSGCRHAMDYTTKSEKCVVFMDAEKLRHVVERLQILG